MNIKAFTNRQNVIACYYSQRFYNALKEAKALKGIFEKAFTIIKHFTKCLKINYLKFCYRVLNILAVHVH